MTTIDLDRIEQLAKAATPGEWLAMHHMAHGIRTRDGQKIVALADADAADLDYIAHIHPGMALALVERIRELETLVGEKEALLQTRAEALAIKVRESMKPSSGWDLIC